MVILTKKKFDAGKVREFLCMHFMFRCGLFQRKLGENYYFIFLINIGEDYFLQTPAF